MRIIKKEKRWKKKPRKDTAQIVNAELQINKEKDNGRSDAEYNQQRHHQVDNQHQVIQEEWQTQKRRSGNQQVRFSNDRTVVLQQQPQIGMVSIPTKNTYIDLEVQEYNTTGEGMETHTQQRQEQSQTDVEGIQVHRDHRN